MKKKIITIVSIIYFLLGNLIVITMNPAKKILGFGSDCLLWVVLAIITLPIDIFIVGSFMVSDSVILFVLFQIISFLIGWIIIYLILKIIFKVLGKNR